MANERFVASSNKRTHYRSAIANVNLHVFQRRSAIMNKNEIRNIKNTRTTSAHAISNRRRQNGVFNRERFECDTANLCGRPLVDDVVIFDRVML
jgi:hypothetical protein